MTDDVLQILEDDNSDVIFVPPNCTDCLQPLEMLGLKQMKCINMVKVQKQEGSKDCGLFVKAMMTSLAYDEDPSVVTYDQSKLRSHLIECFVAQKFTIFPRL